MRNAQLEWCRGLAALYVFLGHYYILGIRSEYQRSLQFLKFGAEAVILFFLLSGAVIRLSVDRQKQSRGDFLRRRAARILPLYWFALGFTLLVQWLTLGRLDSWPVILGNLLLVQTNEAFISPTVSLNGALWSLSFEAFFYVIFALTMGRLQRHFLRVWGVIALAAVVVQLAWNPKGLFGHFAVMFAYSSIWLLGYYLPAMARNVSAGRAAVAMGLGMIPLASRLAPTEAYDDHCAAIHLLVSIAIAPLILSCLRAAACHGPARFDIRLVHLFLLYLLLLPIMWFGPSLPTSRIIYAVLPLVLAAAGFLWQRMHSAPLNPFPHTGLVMGRVSYALYVIHMPVLYWSASSFSDIPTRILFVLGAVPLLVVVMEYAIHPWVSRLFVHRPCVRNGEVGSEGTRSAPTLTAGANQPDRG